MSDIVRDYQSGLIEALLDEEAIRFVRPEQDGGKLRLEYDDAVMGQPGGLLADIAIMGYSKLLKESGLL